MKKFFLIPLMAFVMLFSMNMQAVNVSNLTELQNALATGGEITLTADITTGAVLNVTKGIVLNGNNHCIKGTAGKVIEVKTNEAVVINKLVVFADKSTSSVGLTISYDGSNVELNEVVINSKMRGINAFGPTGSAYCNVTLTINNSTIQLVPNGGTCDENTGMPTGIDYDHVTTGINSDYTRGVNFGRLTDSHITLNNTTIQGFFYNLNNISGTMQGSEVIANSCTFKGRAALNVWGSYCTYEINDANVVGINNWAGNQESFASFVFNNNGADDRGNHLTINGGTIVAAYFNAIGEANPNARQFLIRAQGVENVIEVNNAQYTCTKEAEDSKGGVIEYASATAEVTVNGGIYDCPEIVEGVYSNGESVANITINGGTFDLNVVSADMTDGDLYRAVEINGGNFTIADTDKDLDAEKDGNGLLGEGMTINENVNGSATIMPAEEAANVKTVDDIEGDADAYQLQVEAGKTLTVANNETVTIGEGGVILEDATSQIVVEEGGKLVLNGDINGEKNVNSIIINSSEENTASLVINPDVNVYGDEHPKGTFRLISKDYTDGDTYVWQRFGIPTFDGNVNMTWDGVATWIKKADTQTETYTNILSGNTTGNVDFTGLVPFASYTMNSDHTAPGAVYTFTGNLMGNQNADLHMVKGKSGWNYFANSYTAPIDIQAMLQTLKANYGDNVSVTIYVYKPAGNTWDVINLAELELAALNIPGFTVPQTKINPMQAFILYLYNGTEVDAQINYNDNVFAPATTAAPSRMAASNISNAIRFTVANSEYSDNMTVIEGADFSESFDNGYDAQKYMNEAQFNLYAATADGNMATVATNDIEGTRLAFNAANAGNYTITFNTNAANYALKDNVTNAVVSIENGATYSFSAEAGVNEARFSIIGRADAPTALENTNAAVKRAGIYTLQGQYLGETSMFNTLPQGVYVVDGKKVVR